MEEIRVHPFYKGEKNRINHLKGKSEKEFEEIVSLRTTVRPSLETMQIGLIYLIFGSLWILLSDWLLGIFVSDQTLYQQMELYKGWFYVLITAILLGLLTYRVLNLYKKSIVRLVASYEEINAAYEELTAMNDELSSQFDEIERSKKQLVEKEELYQLVVEGSSDGIWDWQIKEQIYHISDDWKAYFGYSPEDINEDLKHWEEHIVPDDLILVNSQKEKVLSGESDIYEATYRLTKKNGDICWLYSRGKMIRDSSGNPMRMAGSHKDITKTKEMEDKLERLAYFDTLTDLPNRLYFEKEVEKQIQSGRKFAVVNIDMDDLKHVNDVLGPETGDLLIKRFAGILQEQFKEPNMVARLSGDQFFLLLLEVEEEEEIIYRLKRLFEEIRKPWRIENEVIRTTASAGITLYPTHGDTLSKLTQKAEIAMVLRKGNGKNGFTFFQPYMYEETLSRIKMHTKLKEGVENREFFLLYQPQIDLKTSQIIGVEALIRWEHPAEGLISPMYFIPLAEKNSMIVPISMWVLKTAILMRREWQRETGRNIKMAVNMSGFCITDQDAMDSVIQMLELMDVRPGELEIEVTETAVMVDLEKAIKNLTRLREKGVTIAMDDFGTGYSSLTYLNTLPFDVLKIDREFLNNVQNDAKNSFIYDCVVELAHHLKLEIIAEGIETEEQKEFVTNYGCDYGQGYYFDRPMLPEHMKELLLTVE